MKPLLWTALVLAGCGGATSRPETGAGASADDDALVLTLYRDSVVVWDQRHFDLTPGRNTVAFDGVPRELSPGSVSLVAFPDRDIRAKALVTSLQAGATGQATGLPSMIGETITASTSGGLVTGVLREVDRSGVTIQTDGSGTRKIAMEDVRWVRSDTTPDREPLELRWTVESTRGGRVLLQVGYATGGITWHMRYSLIIDDATGAATLQAWLVIENRTAARFRDAQIRLVDIGQRADAEDGESGRDGEPGRDDPRPDMTAGSVARKLFVMDQPITINAHSTMQYALFSTGVRHVKASAGMLYDPVGTAFDQKLREPVSRQFHGIRSDPAVSRSVSIDFIDDGTLADRLPAGRLEVFRRVGADLVLHGAGQAFDDDIKREQPTLVHVELGRSSTMHGRRYQSDYRFDGHARRLVEEIRIELTNRGQTDRMVTVREPMYRSLNWTLAYHNAVSARKETRQAVLFEIPVPAGGSALLVYRVVYIWYAR